MVVVLMGGKVGDPGPPMPALSDAALQSRSSMTDLARHDVRACMTLAAVHTKEKWRQGSGVRYERVRPRRSRVHS
ncbi:hypothetical protein FOA52_011339 [Chlamydomonas sp. UWO 241]|nr:hypothetical protein FOA52_011339 [Chlamydomonas sp. UWO 241]